MFGIYTRIRQRLSRIAEPLLSPLYRIITYTLRPLLKKHIAIMIPAPLGPDAKNWGDYHFALAMKNAFQQHGYHITLRFLSQWHLPFFGRTVIVLRGLDRYTPKPEHINIMWNISHSDLVTAEEYNLFDMVYVASELWAKELSEILSTRVEPLLQCSDPRVFHPGIESDTSCELLFVGNTRNVFRNAVKLLLPTDYNLHVWGMGWESFIPSKYIKGTYLPNESLAGAYHSCCILLNDHWEDMKNRGFISNRIFDGLAAGAFIISDEVETLHDLLPNCVVTYHDRDDLLNKIEYYMNHPAERKEYITRGQNLVLTRHTFDNRIQTMIGFIESHSLYHARKNKE